MFEGRLRAAFVVAFFAATAVIMTVTAHWPALVAQEPQPAAPDPADGQKADDGGNQPVRPRRACPAPGGMLAPCAVAHGEGDGACPRCGAMRGPKRPGCPMHAGGGCMRRTGGMHDARPSIPLIGDKAPAFTADTTQGEITFPDDYEGKWVILFSHPADFTPVCTTEFMTFQKMLPQLKTLDCELIGLSIDSKYSHIAWLRSIAETVEYKGMKDVQITFPVIADLKMDVARKYGMVQPSADDTHAVRAVFFIDPEATIRALIYYPAGNGRNFSEIMRLLIALQTADEHNVATPADWQPGDDVILPPPGSCGTAEQRVGMPPAGARVVSWFLTFQPLPRSELNLPPGMQE